MPVRSGDQVTADECAVCPPVIVVPDSDTGGVPIIDTLFVRLASLGTSLPAISTDWRDTSFHRVQWMI